MSFLSFLFLVISICHSFVSFYSISSSFRGYHIIEEFEIFWQMSFSSRFFYIAFHAQKMPNLSLGKISGTDKEPNFTAEKPKKPNRFSSSQPPLQAKIEKSIDLKKNSTCTPFECNKDWKMFGTELLSHGVDQVDGGFAYWCHTTETPGSKGGVTCAKCVTYRGGAIVE